MKWIVNDDLDMDEVNDGIDMDDFLLGEKTKRLVKWNAVEALSSLLKQTQGAQEASWG